MDFDKSGNYLAVGDCGGRVILFKRNTAQRKPTEVYIMNFNIIIYECYQLIASQRRVTSKQHSREWIPYFQFQSHEAEFDCLKSVDIEEKITKLKFFKESVGGNQKLLTTNGEYYVILGCILVTLCLHKLNYYINMQRKRLNYGKLDIGMRIISQLIVILS